MKIKRYTIKDVAERAGVSISVVSYVLNDTPGRTVTPATKQRILDAAKELDYSPDSIARGMKTKRSMSIGLVSFWKVTDSVFIQILDGVTNAAGKNDYNVVLCGLHPGHNEFEYAELYKRRNIDGVILVSPPEGVLNGFEEPKHVDLIKKYGIPSVIINGYTFDDRLNYIYIDYYQSAYITAEYMIGLGHRRLAYILPSEDEMKNFRSRERLEGFQDALNDNGIKASEDHICRFEDMDALIVKISSGTGPTGIIANKSNYGREFLMAAHDKGIKIPGEVSVIAANTEPYAPFLFPPLTSVEVPLSKIGERSVKMLLDSMEGKIGNLKLKLPNRIIERNSCARV